jgi:hypothetical protein
MARRALALWWVLLLAAAVRLAGADDPYRYFDWAVTYGPINPLGTAQQVCLYKCGHLPEFCYSQMPNAAHDL